MIFVITNTYTMRNTITSILAVAAIVLTSQIFAQHSICMVSADYQDGEDYLVMWEEITDPTADSVIIYRKTGAEVVFTRIGAMHVDAGGYFTDNNVNTYAQTKYMIAIKDNSGSIGPMSKWHQGVVLDWLDSTGAGDFAWTAYEIEDQVDDSYILSYEPMMDEIGIGSFVSMGILMNYDFNYQDPAFDLHLNAQYQILVSLPSCDVPNKTNINTSRSNIKRQFSNAVIGLDENETVQFNLSPNPVADNMTIDFSDGLNSNIVITDLAGKQFLQFNDVSKGITISTQELSAGSYILHIERDGVITSKFFVKQ